MSARRHTDRTTDPKAEYIAIATRLFAWHGFHGVSLAAVADESGVTKQALLHFFGTKERLYREVLDALCARLVAEIEAFASPDPTKHLSDYMSVLVRIDPARTLDARLVIHALLGSDPKAKHWPLKPYLDRLIALVRAVPTTVEVRDDAALAWAFQIIGSVQYRAISAPTVAGMYSTFANETFDVQMRRFVDAAVADLTSGRPSGIAAPDQNTN